MTPQPSSVSSITNYKFPLVSGPAIFLPMQMSEPIQCPFCGQSFDLVIDTSIASQRFTTDCEVCCRPFEVVAECEPGEILSLDVLGG
jgi:hypothetical protein